ncbi:hypothetical protein AC1031_004559 [Aphanomyces cochlioides]|nr:hypothetical protein AC1031_004559 [Aphanomyces cochlioides]
MSIVRQSAGLVAALAIGSAIAFPTHLTLYAGVSLGINCLVALVHAIPNQSELFFDITGSITFVTLSVLVTWLTFPDHSDGVALYRSLGSSLLVIVWAIRLGFFLFGRIRADGNVDSRFVEIRVLPLRFFSVFSIQALWVLISLLPVLLLQTSPQSLVVGVWDIVGPLLFVIGLTLEVTADAQKTAFRANPANKDRFISTGLWRYSRHPNYFGEILLWLGIAVLSIPQLPSLSFQLVASLSPIFSFLLLTFVSGVPQLESKGDAKWGDDKEYLAYKNGTSALVPWFPAPAPLANSGTTYGSTNAEV